MDRRELLKLTLGTCGMAAVAGVRMEAPAGSDGTPDQFVPKGAPDANPLQGEFEKYPKCPYCGMNRREHHRTRMLVQYSDDLVDGVCSIHCLALSLGLNIDRDPKGLWGTDYGSSLEPRPLLPVEKLTYLLGADLKHAMTRRSKHGFASIEVAKTFQTRHGGTLVDFQTALREGYLDMAEDVAMIRRNRAARQKHSVAKQMP